MANEFSVFGIVREKITIFLLFFMVCLSVVVVVCCVRPGESNPNEDRRRGWGLVVDCVRPVVHSGGAVETGKAAGSGVAVAPCGVEQCAVFGKVCHEVCAAVNAD